MFPSNKMCSIHHIYTMYDKYIMCMRKWDMVDEAEGKKVEINVFQVFTEDSFGLLWILVSPPRPLHLLFLLTLNK